MNKKKSIAIITFAFSNRNYGQILQAYALQKYLELQGCDPYIINYQPSRLEYMDSIKPIKSYLKYFIKNLPLIRQHLIQKENKEPDRELILNNRNFDKFKLKYLHYSDKKYHTFKELKHTPPIADLYITGSDQVWSRSIPNSKPYLLEFTNSKNKISYAASFGRSQLESFEKELFKKGLTKYKEIGVRELSGTTLCKELGCTNYQYTPDPTILLEPSEWKKLISQEKLFKTSKKKIFIYSCYLNRKDLIERFVDLEDFEIIVEDVINDDPDIAQLSLENWIKAISEADYVITNSFHATMFSLYLGTPFVTFKYGDNRSKMNTRLESILSQTKLSYRFIPLSSSIEETFKILHQNIDWEFIDAELKSIRQIGVDFLSRHIKY